jgi:hypothetical protein
MDQVSLCVSCVVRRLCVVCVCVWTRVLAWRLFATAGIDKRLEFANVCKLALLLRGVLAPVNNRREGTRTKG